MSLDYYTRIKVIGKGSYGEVWLCKHLKDKKQYVLKKMDLQNASKRERTAAEQEAKLLSKLRHPNIVAYKDSFETEDGFLYIGMSFCEGGDLYTRLKQQSGTPLEERQVVEWFVQIAMALQYMHERNILHRDLKTQNIFLTKSKIIKLGDLGIARVLEGSNDMATTLIGTPYYMSPELFSNKPYNHKSDVWALGCCVYEMATLKHAFNAKDMNSLVYKILKGKIPSMPKHYTSELLELIRAMLNQDPTKRPSVNRILRNAYIKKNIAVFLEGTKKSRRSSTSSTASSRPNSASRERPNSGSRERPRSGGKERPGSGGREKLPPGGRAKAPPDVDELQASIASVSKVDVDVSPSDEVARELTPIQEVHTPRSSGDGPLKGKEKKFQPTQASEEPSKPRRKKKVRSKAETDSGIESGVSVDPDDNQSGKKSLFENARSVAKPRPLPPPPSSSGTPQKKRDRLRPSDADDSSSTSVSSSVGSSKDDYDVITPRMRPNSSARQRRRMQKLRESSETPRESPRETPRRNSEDLDDVDSARQRVRTPQKSKEEKPRRQQSLEDDDSSEDDDDDDDQDDDDDDDVVVVEKKWYPKSNKPTKTPKDCDSRKDKEMNNFISLLDTTLHLNKADEKSDDEMEEELQPVVEQQRGPSPAMRQFMPGNETLSASGRLMDRIIALRRDCIKGLGVEKLKKAYEILENIDGDELEPRLMALLGKNKFDIFAGKIWQLKFCEESAIGMT